MRVTFLFHNKRQSSETTHSCLQYLLTVLDRKMPSKSYFYDQSSPASRLGGIYRSKRNLDDLNQALCQAKTAVTFEEQKQSHSVDKTLGNLQISYLSDIILKELDLALPTFDIQQDEHQSITSLPSSLILQLHSSWNDLIKNTEYKQKVFHSCIDLCRIVFTGLENKSR